MVGGNQKIFAAYETSVRVPIVCAKASVVCSRVDG